MGDRGGEVAAPVRGDSQPVVRLPPLRIELDRALEEARAPHRRAAIQVQQTEALAGGSVVRIAFQRQLEGLLGQRAIPELLVDGADLQEWSGGGRVVGDRLHVQVHREIEVAIAPGLVSAQDALGCGSSPDTRSHARPTTARHRAPWPPVCRRLRRSMRPWSIGRRSRTESALRPSRRCSRAAKRETVRSAMNSAHFATLSPRNSNTPAMRMTAGPTATMKNEGNRQNTSGNTSLVPILAASSSARCMRLSRNSSA